MENIFSIETTAEVINRINQLKSDSPALWGTMNVAQMLAHCSVTYEMIYTDKHPKATGFKRFLLKLFVKPIVCNEKPYPKNSRTATAFVVADKKDFEQERKRLVDYIKKTQLLGTKHFEGMESNSFGKLTSIEWNNMLYKHLNHHLEQFGV